MKRALQVIVAVLSLLPLAVGTLGFVFGAGLCLPADTSTPKLDSQFRFLSAWDIGLAFKVWWIIPRIEYQTTAYVRKTRSAGHAVLLSNWRHALH